MTLFKTKTQLGGQLNAAGVPPRKIGWARDAWKLSAEEDKVSGRVAVIGDGVVVCEAAEHLAEQGCKLSIVEMQGRSQVA